MFFLVNKSEYLCGWRGIEPHHSTMHPICHNDNHQTLGNYQECHRNLLDDLTSHLHRIVESRHIYNKKIRLTFITNHEFHRNISYTPLHPHIRGEHRL